MNCKTTLPLLSEFVDERLDAARAWQVQTHLAECAACTRACRETETLRRALQTLPTRQPSASFDAALAQRLALTRRTPKRQTWQDRVHALFPRPAFLRRPALALAVAAVSVGGILLFPAATPKPSVSASARTADHAFVADCVAQRSRDTAGEPLADMAAQNLTDRLDPAAPSSAPAPPDNSTGPF